MACLSVVDLIEDIIKESNVTHLWHHLKSLCKQLDKVVLLEDLAVRSILVEEGLELDSLGSDFLLDQMGNGLDLLVKTCILRGLKVIHDLLVVDHTCTTGCHVR